MTSVAVCLLLHVQVAMTTENNNHALSEAKFASYHMQIS